MDLSTVHAVVEKIVNSGQVHAPHTLSANIRNRCPDPGFDAQKRKSLRKFFVEGFGRKRTVLVPPDGGRSICACARFVTRTFTAQLAMTTRELREHFLR
jgi:hypothetical protein